MSAETHHAPVLLSRHDPNMTSSAIEALYIFNQNNEPLLEHVYCSRPASSRTLLPLYLARPTPRPSLIFLPNINPPTTLFSLTHANLLFLVPASTETEPLFVLEFLHRLIDVLEEFLSAPLLASKIETSYDVVAQLLSEMCDAGNVCNTEGNALRDVVNMPGWVDKLLGGVGLPGSAPSLNNTNTLKQQLALQTPNAGPAIPWRRANVRHTSNELYVDIIESLSVILAPSGKPLAAFANGSILFNSKLSGVPDLLLNLTVPSGKHTIDKIMELPTFHPCVRLARWRERPGELSFVPPDGKFVLAGYEVNLLPSLDFTSLQAKSLNLPILVQVDTSLGTQGADFEVRLILTPLSSSTSSSRSGGSGPSNSGVSTPSFFGSSSTSSGPSLRDVTVTIPIPEDVRNLTDLRASRGEATFSPVEHLVEWRISTKDAASPGNATLRCTVVGPIGSGDGDDAPPGFGFDPVSGDYSYDETEQEPAYQSGTSSVQTTSKPASTKGQAQLVQDERDAKRVVANKALMPTSAAVSFSVKGWLASGIKVDSLNIDARKSRGLGEGVRPVKGAKYLTVSRRGVETRC